jgi:processive 1,2-diacylglycerol beta-glucosyltransferase
MTRKRILILTLSFGSGHVVASAAIEEALRAFDSAAEVKVLDCIERGSWWFRALYVWPYWLMIRHAPWLWARLFRTRHEKQHRQTAPRWLFRWGCRQVFREIRQWQPEVLVATEVGACEIASLAKKRGWTQAPLVAVSTDHESEPAWVTGAVDQYFVSTEEVAAKLRRWGVDRRRIVTSGIPVLRKFHEKGRGAASKEKLGLAVDRPMVLVMGGGMGPLPMDQIVSELARLPMPLSIVAVAGLNSRMKKKLERSRRQMPFDKSLEVYGWMDCVDELMRAADVLVTKPGGLTLTEAASVGTPMVCVNPIPGPEERHCELIERENLGVVARSIEEVSSHVARWVKVSHPAPRCAPEWLRRDSAQQIAAAVLEISWRLSPPVAPARKPLAELNPPSILQSEQFSMKSFETELPSR